MDRSTLSIGLGVLVLVGLALGLAIFRQQAPPDLSTPSGVVLAYALAEQQGDAQAAWDLLSADVQATHSRQAFMTRATGGRGDRTIYSTQDEQQSSDTARVVLVRTYVDDGFWGGGSDSSRMTVRLVREPSGWRITQPPDPWVLDQPEPGVSHA